jgi:hypothetical protein
MDKDRNKKRRREQSCGIGTFLVEKMDMSRLSQVLFEKHKVYQAMFTLPA